MAAPDVWSVKSVSLANDGYMTIQPGVGEEVTIHTIVGTGEFIVTLYDGTNTLGTPYGQGPGPCVGLLLELTNGVYARVQNKSGGAAHFVAIGMQTK